MPHTRAKSLRSSAHWYEIRADFPIDSREFCRRKLISDTISLVILSGCLYSPSFSASQSDSLADPAVEASFSDAFAERLEDDPIVLPVTWKTVGAKDRGIKLGSRK